MRCKLNQKQLDQKVAELLGKGWSEKRIKAFLMRKASKRKAASLPKKAEQVMQKAIQKYFPNIAEDTKNALRDAIIEDYSEGEESDLNNITVHDVVEIFDASGFDENDEGSESDSKKYIQSPTWKDLQVSPPKVGEIWDNVGGVAGPAKILNVGSNWVEIESLKNSFVSTNPADMFMNVFSKS